MKTKIKDALKQQYAKLGLGDEVFEGVASSVATFVTDENLENFVSGAESILKQFQSTADSARSRKTTELEARVKELEISKSELENKLKKGGDEEVSDGLQKDNAPDMAKVIAEAVAAAVAPLNTKIETLESARLSKESVSNAHDTFFGGDYVKKFKEEANDAWERTIELYEATGKKMTADELKGKAEGYFNKVVARKGVDTSKPLSGDGAGDNKPDFSDDVAMLEKEGLLKKGDTN